MRLTIRTISRLPSGRVSQKDQTVEIEGRRIKLGRGTDNDLALKDLRVNYRHADILVREEDIVVEAIDDSLIRLDGVPVERGALTPESELEVGPYRIQVVDASLGGHEVTLAVELVSPAPAGSVEAIIDPRRTRLGGGFLGKRGWSWLLFLLLLAVSLIIPIWAYMAPKPKPGSPERPTLLTSFDRVWTSGDLSAPHKFLSQNCGACHEKAFISVRPEACASCHQTVQHHFEVARFEFAGFTPTDCMSCHNEHQGPTGHLPTQQALCADCHEDLSRTHTQTTLVDAADFGKAHPQFRPTVITDPGSGKVERVALGAANFPKENHGLIFPHDIHMARVCEKPPSDSAALANWPKEKADACKVLQDAKQRMNKNQLECGDCHQPDSSGTYYPPATMEDYCAVCHRLEFDPSSPERLLPHGQPDDVIGVINDYYAARASRGQPVVEPVPLKLRRRVGDAGSTAAQPQRAAPVQSAAATGSKRLDTIFGESLCGECHEVIPPAQSEKRKWEVRPVRVASIYMPKSQFDHAAHSTTPCADCHKAETSKTSADVLLPDIASCRNCHQGEAANTALPSTCIMCHVYHRKDLPPMLPHAVSATANAQTSTGAANTR